MSADVASVWTRLLENCWLLSVCVSFVFCSCIGGFEVLSDDLSAVVFTYEKVGNFCGCVRIHSVRVSLVVGGCVSWCLLRICSSHFFLFFECLPVFWEVFPPPFCVDRFLEFSSCFCFSFLCGPCSPRCVIFSPYLGLRQSCCLQLIP